MIVASCHGNFPSHGQLASITPNFIPTNTGLHQSSTRMLFFLGINGWPVVSIIQRLPLFKYSPLNLIMIWTVATTSRIMFLILEWYETIKTLGITRNKGSIYSQLNSISRWSLIKQLTSKLQRTQKSRIFSLFPALLLVTCYLTCPFLGLSLLISKMGRLD